MSTDANCEDPRLLPAGGFDAVLESELKRAVRAQQFLTLVVMEAQREWEGLMLTADEGTVTELAVVVCREVRVTDLAAHTATGTLSLVLLDADFEHATRVVDRLMSRIDSYGFPTPLHIAVGAASYPTHAVDAASLRRQAIARPLVNWRSGPGARAERN